MVNSEQITQGEVGSPTNGPSFLYLPSLLTWKSADTKNTLKFDNAI